MEMLATVFGKMKFRKYPETGRYCVSTSGAKKDKTVAWPSFQPTLGQMFLIATREFPGVPWEKLVFGTIFGQMYMKRR